MSVRERFNGTKKYSAYIGIKWGVKNCFSALISPKTQRTDGLHVKMESMTSV